MAAFKAAIQRHGTLIRIAYKLLFTRIVINLTSTIATVQLLCNAASHQSQRVRGMNQRELSQLAAEIYETKQVIRDLKCWSNF